MGNGWSAKLLLVYCPAACRIDSNVSIAAKVTRTSYKKDVARPDKRPNSLRSAIKLNSRFDGSLVEHMETSSKNLPNRVSVFTDIRERCLLALDRFDRSLCLTSRDYRRTCARPVFLLVASSNVSFFSAPSTQEKWNYFLLFQCSSFSVTRTRFSVKYKVLLIGIKKVIVVEGIFKWRIASRQTKCHLSEFRLNPGFERSRSTITNEDYLGS